MLKLLEEMGERRPRLIMLENVLGFLMKHGGRDLEKALLALNELGYAMDAVILNAVHWVPQSRARLFLIGKQKKTKSSKLLVPVSRVRPRPLADFILEHRNIRWDIHELPALPEPRLSLADIVEDLADDDPHWWNKKRATYFMNQLSERHSAEAQKMIKGECTSYATAFRRVRNEKSMAELRTDGIAGCLRTPRGGSGRQILFKAGLGKYQVRLLTARECARLQGVPESYSIDVALNQALFGFGDAVCVPTIEWLISHHLSKVASPHHSECVGT
jgi:DNA (cytosine-5)-methyltransferase 1